MSQHDEDAGLVGDALAELVEQGQLTDRMALAYIAGDRRALISVGDLLARHSNALRQGETS